MSSDGLTQSQLNKECEEMIQDSTPETSRNHRNPKLEEMKQIVLFQIEKYSFWFPEKCSSTKDGFQARSNQGPIRDASENDLLGSI